MYQLTLNNIRVCRYVLIFTYIQRIKLYCVMINDICYFLVDSSYFLPILINKKKKFTKYFGIIFNNHYLNTSIQYLGNKKLTNEKMVELKNRYYIEFFIFYTHNIKVLFFF